LIGNLLVLTGFFIILIGFLIIIIGTATGLRKSSERGTEDSKGMNGFGKEAESENSFRHEGPEKKNLMQKKPNQK
jgi:uncharacterized membrane protein